MPYAISRGELKIVKDFIAEEGRRIIIFHRDADGTASASLFMKIFPDFECVPLEVPKFEEKDKREIISRKPTHLVILDLAIDQDRKSLFQIRKETKAKILILDHHIVEKDLNGKDIFHLNPRFRERDAYIPTSYHAYRILEKIDKRIKDFCWISGIGVIGDYAFKECRDILEECRKRFPDTIKNSPRESNLALAGRLIYSAIILKGSRGALKTLDILVSSATFEEFFHNQTLNDWKSLVESEIKKMADDFEKNKKEYSENLIVYEIKSNLNLTSVLSTILAERNPEKTIVIKKFSGKGWKVSLRNQSGVLTLDKVVKASVKGIGFGGGHEKAAGAYTTDWETFLKRLQKNLKKA